MSSAEILVPLAVKKVLDANPDWVERTSPGLRFQRYLDLWEGVPDTAGGCAAAGGGLKRKKQGREAVLRKVTRGLAVSGGRQADDFARLLDALQRRQTHLFALNGPDRGLVFDLDSDSPLVTGLGKEHPLESGMAFLKPYGVPYVAGSGVKGALRAACGRLFGETRAGEVFGTTDEQARSDGKRRRGLVDVWDLFPSMPKRGGMFRVDLVNPHYPDYYQGGEPPADWQNPVPSFFLTLKSGVRWRLHVVLGSHVGSANPDDWRGVVQDCVREVGSWSGMGGKKSWGYGLFTVKERDEEPRAAAGGSNARSGEAKPRPDGAGAGGTGASVSGRPGEANAPRAVVAAPQTSPQEQLIAGLSSAGFGRLDAAIRQCKQCAPGEAARLRGLLLEKIDTFDAKSRKKWRAAIEAKWPVAGSA